MEGRDNKRKFETKKESVIAKHLFNARIYPGQSMFENRPEEHFVQALAIKKLGFELTFKEK